MSRARTSVKLADHGRLSREWLLTLAEELVDGHGVDALTMSGLARAAGVTPMALYRHVGTADQLRIAVLDRGLEPLIDAEESDDWRVGVERWMREVRAVRRRRAWVGPLLAAHHGQSTAWMLVVDRLARALQPAHLGDGALAASLVWTTRSTMGLITLESAAPLPRPSAELEQLMEQLDPAVQTRWRQLLPSLRQVDDDALFDALIALTIGQIETLRAS